jgi:hypothetical protein
MGSQRLPPQQNYKLRLQKRWNALYSTLRREFFNYAVGPWVSVAGREAALARGNPAKEFSDLMI